ncbi:MAG TPA: hypothetical protein VFL46_02480 [Phycicoccus sp.]|nr:hypothetical protein [Phycicoccus sp.]
MTTRRTAGLALGGYALATLVAFTGAGVPGGDYEPGKLTGFLTGGHLAPVVLGWLGAAAAVALLPVGRYLREALGGVPGGLAHDLSVVATSAGVVGWTASTGLTIAVVEGGPHVATGLPLPVAYAVGEVANLLAVCAPAFGLGALALLVARSHSVPAWVRGVSLLGAVGGLTAPLFFTYFVFLVWALVLGGWLALRPAPSPVAPSVPASLGVA